MERMQMVRSIGAVEVVGVARNGIADYTLSLRLHLLPNVQKETLYWGQRIRFGYRAYRERLCRTWQIIDEVRNYSDTYLIDSGVVEAFDRDNELVTRHDFDSVRLSPYGRNWLANAAKDLAARRIVDVVIDFNEDDHFDIAVEHIDRPIVRPSKLAAQITRNLSASVAAYAKAYGVWAMSGPDDGV